MPGNVVIGNTTYTEQPIEKSYSQSKGWQTTRRFRGSLDSLTTLADQFIVSGWAVKIVGGPVAELTCNIGGETDANGDPSGGAEQPVSTWEIQGNAGEIDILKSYLVDTIAAADRSLLYDIQKGTKKSEDVSSADFVDGESVSLWKLMLDGQSSIKWWYPTLRHTKTASNVYTFDPALEFVGEIISTAKLLNTQDVPNSISNQFHASSQVTRNGMVFNYGWLVAFPQISITIDNKSQLIQEWEWGLWADDAYTYNA